MRTYPRWQADADRRGDGRPLAKRPKPAHALSEAERRAILDVVNEPRFAELPPARIVPALADKGCYLASESSFYRVLRAHHQVRHRGRAHAPAATPKPPTTHQATRPRQVWCWDMTYLPTAVIGQWFYLYLILDLYSRKIVGFTVEASDHSDHAAHLLRRTALAEGIYALADKPVLHGDNGATMARTTPFWPHANSSTKPRAMQCPLAGAAALATGLRPAASPSTRIGIQPTRIPPAAPKVCQWQHEHRRQLS